MSTQFLLYLHIALGVSSLGSAVMAKTKLTYSLLGGTLLSGTGLFLLGSTGLGRLCISGAVFTLGVLITLRVRQARLAKQA